MASAASATRAVSKAASNLLPAAKGHTARAGLIYEMHSRLYPHLYDSKVEKVDSKKEDGSVKRWLPEGKTERGRRFWEGKGQWVKEYEDEKKMEMISHTRHLQIYPTKPSIHKTCPTPISILAQSQIALLDPTGARTRLFSPQNPECARVGDILLVRQRTGDPFAGVCINIRRRGVDTAILLRGQLTRVGVEMWFKIYSPLVEGIEVVQRAQKRARRARLTYMRKAKHDRGSVENVVRVYLRQKAALGTAEGKKKGAAAAAAAAAGGKKKAKGKGRGRR